MSNKNAHQLIQSYLEGSFEHLPIDKKIEVGNDLFDRLECYEDLVPMLESRFETAQWWACYYVSEATRKSSGIFPYVVPLIDSDKASIRRIACECFRWHSKTGSHVAAVMRCLEDTDRAVRLTAVLALTDFDPELIRAGSMALRTDGYELMAEAIDAYVLGDAFASDVKPESLRDKARLHRLCYYVSARRCEVPIDKLRLLARQLSERDLIFMHRSYPG